MHEREQLENDGRRDVRHHAQGDDREPLKGASGEHVKHVQNSAALLIEHCRERNRVYAWHRDVGANAENHQRTQQEP